RRLDLSAFLEGQARPFAVVTDALRVDISSAHAADNRIRNLLLANFLFNTAYRVWDLLDAGLLDHPRHVARDLLHHCARNPLADGVRNLLDAAFLDIRGARYLLRDAPSPPDFTAADAWRLLAYRAAIARGAVMGPAGARVEAAFARNSFPANMLPARHAVFLVHPFTAAAGDCFAGRHRLADGPDAFLVAGLRHGLVRRAADFLDDAFGNRPASRAAYLSVAGFGDRLAHRVAALATVLFTDPFLDT